MTSIPHNHSLHKVWQFGFCLFAVLFLTFSLQNFTLFPQISGDFPLCSSLSPVCQRSSHLWQSVNIWVSRNWKTSCFPAHSCVYYSTDVWVGKSSGPVAVNWQICSGGKRIVKPGLVWAFTKCHSSLYHACKQSSIWHEKMTDFLESLETSLQEQFIFFTVIIGGFPVNSLGAMRAPTDSWGPMMGFLSSSSDPGVWHSISSS